MTTEEMKNLFDKHNDEYHDFDNIINKLSDCHDLHAFLLLKQLMPDLKRIIECGEHDIIYLSPDTDELASIINESQIIDLIRCGVMYHDDIPSLAMFV